MTNIKLITNNYSQSRTEDEYDKLEPKQHGARFKRQSLTFGPPITLSTQLPFKLEEDEENVESETENSGDSFEMIR